MQRGDQSKVIRVGESNTDRQSNNFEYWQYRAKVGKYPPLLIFPEGALTNGKVLIQFRAGAFDAEVPVTPVVIEYPYDEASGWSAAGTNLRGDFVLVIVVELGGSIATN